VPLCGEFQRIALSATVKPLEGVAEFIGGWERKAPGGEDGYEKRPVKVVASGERKHCELRVCAPEGVDDLRDPEAWWTALAADFRRITERNRSTIFFVNSRRMSEKVAGIINEQGPGDPAYAHHGSLSREIRAVVEERLKSGVLSAIVATGSLELGIDIGSVDEVVLVQAPMSIASAVQRIGRSGHSVGERSRGTFHPMHGRDFLEAAVLAARVDARDIEPIRPLRNPLDVLAQVVVSMAAHEERDLDEIYRELRTSWPYHTLGRREFDLVIEMLAGRYQDARIRELRPRLAVDRIRNTAKTREHAVSALYLSGGVIPDRGYFHLRTADSRARIGELDEEFVWERSVGDAFPLGSQVWQIQRITHNDVEVVPARKPPIIVPFWKGEELDRPFHYAERIARFLEEADEELDSPAFHERLLGLHHMTEPAADHLIQYLRRQRAFTGASLPHRHHLLVEHYRDPANTAGSRQTVLHTLWGGRVNRPFSLALAAAWEEKYGYPLETYVNNDCILLNLPHAFSPEQVPALLTPENLVRLLRSRLEGTGFFGARFRENAQRALLLPRRSFRERMPLWLNRLRSKKLLQAVSRYHDFPVLLETWRECMEESFDLPVLGRLLEELAAGDIGVTEVETRSPSPFAEGVVWFQTNKFMYQDDTPGSGLRTRMSDNLFQEVVHSGRLRPGLSGKGMERFREKRQRVGPGYAPEGPEELVEWVKERRFIPYGEWVELLEAVRRDHGTDLEELQASVNDRIHVLRRGEACGVIALEDLGRVQRALGSSGPGEGAVDLFSRFLAEWLRFYGPVTRGFIRETLGADRERLDRALDLLLEERTLVEDVFREDAGGTPVEEEVCDAENLEILLRLQRLARRPSFTPLPSDALPLFQAEFQGLSAPGEGPEDLRTRLEQLFGYPAGARLWETAILPARLAPYAPALLDAAVHESELIWAGHGREKLYFCFESDVDLFRPGFGAGPGKNGKPGIRFAEDVARIFKDIPGRMTFRDLAAVAGGTMNTEELTQGLWDLFWRGRVTCDAFASIRAGIRNRFRAEKIQDPVRGRGGRRTGFNRWKNTRPYAGSWVPLPQTESDQEDPLEREALVRDRVRILLARYGVLFRERLWNELPGFRWGDIFRTLRLMELGGEVFTGHFFQGVPGLQFCSPAAFRALTRPLPEGAVYWMNAADPASLCGVPLEELRASLPGRLPTTHLVYEGRGLVLVSRKGGKEVDVLVPPDSPRLPEFLGVFRAMVEREFEPLRCVRVETLNGEPAPQSIFARALLDFGFQKELKGLTLWREYGNS